MTPAVISDILSHYGCENPGVKANLYRILMHGKLAGTGKMVILPVDQGFEHGPDRSFSVNPDAYNPEYHFKLAIDAGLNAYAAPLGMLEAGADKFAGQIPTILKINSNNSLMSQSLEPTQAITSSVDDALRLGCSGIGFTIYPGSEKFNKSVNQLRDIIRDAKSKGLVVVIWSYPRGSGISTKGQNALDVTNYAAHIACMLGANIVKVKLPSDFIEQEKAKIAIDKGGIKIDTLADRVASVKKSCFDGKRIVIFSGGDAKTKEDILDEADAIKNGGGNGSIIGRNAFQRSYSDAISLLDSMVKIYKS